MARQPPPLADHTISCIWLGLWAEADDASVVAAAVMKKADVACFAMIIVKKSSFELYMLWCCAAAKYVACLIGFGKIKDFVPNIFLGAGGTWELIEPKVQPHSVVGCLTARS